jgi:hypothetical protein
VLREPGKTARIALDTGGADVGVAAREPTPKADVVPGVDGTERDVLLEALGGIGDESERGVEADNDVRANLLVLNV